MPTPRRLTRREREQLQAALLRAAATIQDDPVHGWIATKMTAAAAEENEQTLVEFLTSDALWAITPGSFVEEACVGGRPNLDSVWAVFAELGRLQKRLGIGHLDIEKWLELLANFQRDRLRNPPSI